jgi:tyrosyl-tRNA synthetase
MFGKLMSISDELMWRYYELLTDLTTKQIEELKWKVSESSLHPMQAKKDLAKKIIADFHSPQEATDAEANWARQFQKDETPENLELVTLLASELSPNGGGAVKLDKLLVKAGLAESNSDAQRKIRAGAVKVDGGVYKELYATLKPGVEAVVRVGRLMKRVKLN